MDYYEVAQEGMTALQALILGIVQGFAEFLPISSSGHLALGSVLFGLEDTMLFHVIVHVGTLIPVVIVFRKDIWELMRRPFQKKTLLLVIATIPAAAVGALFASRIESAFSSLTFIAFGFVITGIALMVSDRIRKNKKTQEEMGVTDAALIGVAQAVAVFPGVSRSGATIVMALGRGINREAAAKFSFLMSIPIILGALAYHLWEVVRNPDAVYINYTTLSIGFVTSAITGYLAIRLLLAAVKKAKLSYFAYYVLALATAITIGQFVF